MQRMWTAKLQTVMNAGTFWPPEFDKPLAGTVYRQLALLLQGFDGHKASKLTRPVVGTGARFHADEAWRQRCDQLKQFGPGHAGANQYGFACGIHTMNGEDVLGGIDTNGDNGHGLPLSTQTSELMRFRTSHLGTWVPIAATVRCARDGEVPFIR